MTSTNDLLNIGNELEINKCKYFDEMLKFNINAPEYNKNLLEYEKFINKKIENINHIENINYNENILDLCEHYNRKMYICMYNNHTNDIVERKYDDKLYIDHDNTYDYNKMCDKCIYNLKLSIKAALNIESTYNYIIYYYYHKINYLNQKYITKIKGCTKFFIKSSIKDIHTKYNNKILKNINIVEKYSLIGIEKADIKLVRRMILYYSSLVKLYESNLKEHKITIDLVNFKICNDNILKYMKIGAELKDISIICNLNLYYYNNGLHDERKILLKNNLKSGDLNIIGNYGLYYCNQINNEKNTHRKVKYLSMVMKDPNCALYTLCYQQLYYHYKTNLSLDSLKFFLKYNVDELVYYNISAHNFGVSDIQDKYLYHLLLFNNYNYDSKYRLPYANIIKSAVKLYKENYFNTLHSYLKPNLCTDIIQLIFTYF